MVNKPEWLPELIRLEHYGGDWKRYVEAVYSCFERDFITDKPMYDNKPVNYKRHPEEGGKVYTFWHVVSSDDKSQQERLPDLRRCERILWPRAIIENYNDSRIKIWENRRKREKRVLLWFEEFDYLVVLAKRKEYYILWTAYCIKYDHTRAKLRKEYEESIKD
ncbi:hypothetical protein [Desulfallas thermosapovorans]|uniref:Phage P1-related protein n=1 Tax=Desulfallas thermosapovorans DSM 6562 TaxID=1121431 RepID=A0A5S4ZQ21_9FIRM|nr:hypothetical protein [Desulfallas thermosapovorans]TYO92804.1 hypothetical protein LX24_02811 [Desulfallas thermosapovorans DSM 6562]